MFGLDFHGLVPPVAQLAILMQLCGSPFPLLQRCTSRLRRSAWLFQEPLKLAPVVNTPLKLSIHGRRGVAEDRIVQEGEELLPQ
jgi:hypothetical protein